MSDWDIGLSQTVTDVVQARLSLYGDGLQIDLLHALRKVRRYITGSQHSREFSPTLESILATVLSPLLQEYYQQAEHFATTEELLAILGDSYYLVQSRVE